MGLTAKNWNLRLAAGAAVVAAAGLASGCMSSPTYGTDKTASAQLVTDLSGMFNFTQAPQRLPRMTTQQLPAWKYKVTKANANDGT